MTSPCAFIIRISNPLLTLRGVADFLLERGIKVKSMNLHFAEDQEGILLIHCILERDRIKHAGHLIEKIKGVIEVEILQAALSNLNKEH